MTEQDRAAFAELLIGIGETYGEPVSDMRMEIYFRALEDLTISDVTRAANSHVRASKFFPRPAELREAVDGSIEDAAEIAWTNVYALVRRHGYMAENKDIKWPDEMTQHAALRLYGGWRALCENLPASGPEMLGTAKLFKAHYAAVARQVQRHDMLPPSAADARLHLAGLKAELIKRGLPTGAL